MVSNLAFITGREVAAKVNPSTLGKQVEVVKASSVLPQIKNVVLPQAATVSKIEYASPYASVGDLAEKCVAGKKLNLSI